MTCDAVQPARVAVDKHRGITRAFWRIRLTPFDLKTACSQQPRWRGQSSCQSLLSDKMSHRPRHVRTILRSLRHFFGLRKILSALPLFLYLQPTQKFNDKMSHSWHATARTGPIVALSFRVPLGGFSSRPGGTIKIYPFFPHVKSSFLPQPRRTLQKPHSKPSLPGTAFFSRAIFVCADPDGGWSARCENSGRVSACEST